MNKIELSQDLSTLTSISKLSLDNLTETAISCIAHNVLETLLEKESHCEVDIGIGNLYIKIENDIIKYKFIPKKSLEEAVAYTVQNKASPLLFKADKALGERIENAYKCLI